MKVVTTIEARMGSSRLPGKTLMDIAGKPLLQRVVDRARGSRRVAEVVVATSTSPGDAVIADYCAAHGIACHRGSEDDVLGRVHEAAARAGAEAIVQSGADSPFFDPDLADFLIEALDWGGYAYAANDMTLTFPTGIYAHVIRFDALAASACEAVSTPEREDTPRFIWNHPDRFPIFAFSAVPGSAFNRPELRLTVDYAEDIELTRRVYQEFGDRRFTTGELIALIDSRSGWGTLNRHCVQRSAAYVPVA